MRLRAGVFSILMASALFGQSATFVAADVHAAPKQELSFSSEDLGQRNRVVLRALTLAHMIALAYGVDDDKISGGPSWNDRLVTDPSRRQGGSADASADAQDPGAGITFFSALEKIGLKMTKEKHTMPVLVVDKIDRAPEN